MADKEAKWVAGKSQLLQERPAQNVEWKWINGKSGDVAVLAYTATPPATYTGPFPTFRRSA